MPFAKVMAGQDLAFPAVWIGCVPGASLASKPSHHASRLASTIGSLDRLGIVSDHTQHSRCTIDCLFGQKSCINIAGSNVVTAWVGL